MLAFLLIENSYKTLSSLPERQNSSLELIKVENMIMVLAPVKKLLTNPVLKAETKRYDESKKSRDLKSYLDLLRLTKNISKKMTKLSQDR